MKIVLVGALRFSNFGDILFAKLFYDRIVNRYKDATVLLYETPFNRVSDFCRKELNYGLHFKLSDLRDADILIFISGGYFSNSFEDIKTKLLWHIRYALPGIVFSSKGKDIYVLGIGGGEFSWKFSEKMIKRILDSAKFVSVRNPETAQKFKLLGTTADIHINSDTAQIISRNRDQYCTGCKCGRKKLFLHIIPMENYYTLLHSRVFPAIKEFMAEHQNYEIITGYDSSAKDKYNKYLIDTVEYFGTDHASIYYYKSVNELLGLLGECDMVITPKLHVGIVSSSFGKSVFSFPINYEKTKRYYKNIGYSERCIDIYTVEHDQILALLEMHHDEGIQIPMGVVESAEENLKVCDSF